MNRAEPITIRDEMRMVDNEPQEMRGAERIVWTLAWMIVGVCIGCIVWANL